MADIKDIYLRGKASIYYDSSRIETGTLLETVIQKLENLLMTNKGELYGDPGFGCSLQKYLFKTSVPKETIQREITQQIHSYIPEISGAYILNISIYEPGVITTGQQDTLVLNFSIYGESITYII